MSQVFGCYCLGIIFLLLGEEVLMDQKWPNYIIQVDTTLSQSECLVGILSCTINYEFKTLAWLTSNQYISIIYQRSVKYYTDNRVIWYHVYVLVTNWTEFVKWDSLVPGTYWLASGHSDACCDVFDVCACVCAVWMAVRAFYVYQLLRISGTCNVCSSCVLWLVLSPAWVMSVSK